MTWKHLVEGTFRAPAATFRSVSQLNLSRAALLQLLLLSIVLSVIMTTLGVLIMPDDLPPEFAILKRPLVYVVVQIALNGTFILLLHQILRMAGGQNRIEDVILAVIWVQGLLMVTSGAQLLVGFLVPLLAVLIAVVSLPYSIWLMAVLANEASGLRSVARTLALSLVALLMAAFLTAFVMIITGVIDPREFTDV